MQRNPDRLQKVKSGRSKNRKAEVCLMKELYAAALTVLFSGLVLAQNAPAPPLQRQLHGQTLISNELPAADFTFDEEFRYIGGQVVSLYGKVDAEQHLFVKAPSTGPVQAFYWVQFEHNLPTNKGTYDYKPDRTTDLGGLPFIYDCKSFPDYAAAEVEDPHSDGAAIARLLAQHNLVFPKRAARVRMFHLPTPDRRTELMIIYGEAVPDHSPIPIRAEALPLDNAFPEPAKTLLDHVRIGLTVRKH
jgi:hypothetical protein